MLRFKEAAEMHFGPVADTNDYYKVLKDNVLFRIQSFGWDKNRESADLGTEA